MWCQVTERLVKGNIRRDCNNSKLASYVCTRLEYLLHSMHSKAMSLTGSSVHVVQIAKCLLFLRESGLVQVLSRISVLGSAFLGIMAVAPAAVEALTGLAAFRGFAGEAYVLKLTRRLCSQFFEGLSCTSLLCSWTDNLYLSID